MMGFCVFVSDVYEEQPDRLSAVLPKLMALSNVVGSEIKYEEHLMQLLGTMDAILSMAHKSQSPHVSNDHQLDATISVLDPGIKAS